MDTPDRLIIRRGTVNDASVVARFNSQLAKETENIELDPPTILAGVEQVLSDANKGVYFLAEQSTERTKLVVGQLMITHEWSDWRNGDIWWIQSVYIDQSARRSGVFRALYQHALTECRAAGAVGIRLYVEKHNTSAQQTYEKLGMHMSDYLVMEEMFHRQGD